MNELPRYSTEPGGKRAPKVSEPDRVRACDLFSVFNRAADEAAAEAFAGGPGQRQSVEQLTEAGLGVDLARRARVRAPAATQPSPVGAWPRPGSREFWRALSRHARSGRPWPQSKRPNSKRFRPANTPRKMTMVRIAIMVAWSPQR